MKNFVQSGDTIDVTLGGTFASGAGILVGTLVGVCASSGVSGDVVPVSLKGVYTLPKASGAISVGAKVYWDNSAKNITTTTSGNTFAGYAVAAAQSGDATANILLARG